jgi:zinc transporter, ZIP family
VIASVLIAVLAAIGFAGSGLLAEHGRAMRPRARGLAVAAAAGILLALAFGDLFPEALRRAGRGAIAGFIGGFAVLFLLETLTHAHTHHAPDDAVHRHALLPFVLGLALHNATDGFVIGISGKLSRADTLLVGIGVLIHQLPVGLSLAAVLAASQLPRREASRIAILLGLAIPAAAIATVTLPQLSDRSVGILTGVAGGIIAYLSAAHLLPEAQTEHPSRATGLVFVLTLTLMTLAVLTILD